MSPGDLLKPSSFKIGCLLVIISCCVFYSFGQTKPELLSSVDNQITSAMFRWRGPQKTTGEILIVDIDEKSLQSIGQWPWPRDILARMVSILHASGAKVIGFDIVFAEKDRTSITEYIDNLEDLIEIPGMGRELKKLAGRDDLNHDLIMGKSVSLAPVVLGYVFQLKDDGLKIDEERPFPSITIQVSPDTVSYQELFLLCGYRAILNIEEIAQSPTEGFLNVFPDTSGMVRKVPLMMELDGIPYPSLSLEMMRTGLDEPTATIHASRQKTMGRNSILGVSIEDHFIPTDDKGQVTVNYRGPVGTFEYLPAIDVLSGTCNQKIRDRYVLIGTSATGLLDFHATPFSGTFPGVEVQATILDNILANDLFTYDIFTEIGLTYTIIIAGGIILSALLAYTGALAGGIAGLFFIVLIISGDYYLFFLNEKLLGITYPLATILSVFLVVTLFNYFFEYRKKQFIQDAFGRYVSPMVINQLLRRPEKLSLTGEEKNLTILFSDIRDFTTISEKMDPKQLGAFMNRYLTAMSDIIMENSGMVDKYIGDAIVAIWGAPLDDKDHVENAVRSSLSMTEKLNELKRLWSKQGLPEITIGVGINTGITSVGNFGSERRFEYTVLGDNVNLASRLEGLTKVYGTGIIISEFTKKALNGRFFCRLLDRVKVKGKDIPIEIFEPLLEGVPDDALRAEVTRFEHALECYRLRDFEQARSIIEDLHSVNPHRLYELYLERIEGFMKEPPPDDWDGTHTFTTK
ncbi:MAG TPA: adenylate/guanylate cyclase domain-containing protein [Deltaproteobacteria bacterium]|nr:adenylate/guanylate cyclase domain-containing protein [Deltaproteobacteria bacterium]